MKKIFFLILVIILGATGYAQKAPISKTVPALCDSVQFYYTAATNVVSSLGTTFAWSRAAVTGIANPATTGSNATINEYLDNTSPNPVQVKYIITMTENTGCSHSDYLFITINPTPHLTTPLSATICDSTAFIYTAATATTGAAFTWSRPSVMGIANPAASGFGTNINEVLSNTTNNDIIVRYVITMTANGCSNADTVYVTVHPTPFLVKMNKRKGTNNNTWKKFMFEEFKQEEEILGV